MREKITTENTLDHHIFSDFYIYFYFSVFVLFFLSFRRFQVHYCFQHLTFLFKVNSLFYATFDLKRLFVFAYKRVQLNIYECNVIQFTIMRSRPMIWSLYRVLVFVLHNLNVSLHLNCQCLNTSYYFSGLMKTTAILIKPTVAIINRQYLKFSFRSFPLLSLFHSQRFIERNIE